LERGNLRAYNELVHAVPATRDDDHICLGDFRQGDGIVDAGLSDLESPGDKAIAKLLRIGREKDVDGKVPPGEEAVFLGRE
jgi:hypothetical protein